MNDSFHRRAVASLALGTFMSVASAGPVRSVGAMTFADADTVVIADWRAGEIHAVQLPPAPNATAKPFNLKNVSTPIARALRTQPDKLRFEDMAFRPGAELAYITVSVDRGAGRAGAGAGVCRCRRQGGRRRPGPERATPRRRSRVDRRRTSACGATCPRPPSR